MSVDDAATAATTPAVVAAFMGSMKALFHAIPGGQWVDSPDLVRYRTGLAAPRFNGVAVLGPAADEDAATAWLDALADAGTPHCVIERPGAPTWSEALAVRRGLTDVDDEPLMVHDDPEQVAWPEAGALALDRIDPDDADAVRLGQEVFADGFEGPLEVLGALMDAAVLRLPGMEAWLGRVDGAAVTVGFGALHDGHVGVFNIATPAPHRRRGHGRAVTAQVVRSGVAAGAHTAYLQASAMGLSVYEAMGFRTVETWPSRYPG